MAPHCARVAVSGCVVDLLLYLGILPRVSPLAACVPRNYCAAVSSALSSLRLFSSAIHKLFGAAASPIPRAYHFKMLDLTKATENHVRGLLRRSEGSLTAECRSATLQSGLISTILENVHGKKQFDKLFATSESAEKWASEHSLEQDARNLLLIMQVGRSSTPLHTPQRPLKRPPCCWIHP
jgi:hypothetical protein